jgi:CubicO group peptidase (beta-lactamase class C family)
MNNSIPAGLTQKLDEIFKPWNRCDAPGAVVGVAQQGKILYRRGFGLASIEHAKANTPTTRMRLGSTTKHFTCLGILLLQEDGKLDIQQPIRTYLPELSNLCGEPTLLQLMHHVGGLRDPMFIAFLLSGGKFSQLPVGAGLQLMARFTERNFAPGEGPLYSNAGYYLLSLVIERLAGTTLEDFFTQRLFAPLGMQDTALLRSDMGIVPNMATLHLPQPGGGWRRGIHPTDEMLGSGGIISTVDDMLLWAAHLRGPHKKFGSAESWSRLLQRPTYRSGQQGSYSLGLMHENYRGVAAFHHAGGTLGAQCQMLIVPQHALDIVVMVNRMDAPAPALAYKIVDAVLEGAGLEPVKVPPPAAEFPAVQGRWFNPRKRTLVSIAPRKIAADQPEVLVLSLYNTPTAVLHRSGEGLAMPETALGLVEIRKLPEGGAAPATLDLHIVGEPQSFERLPDAPPTAAELAADLVARYRNAEFGFEVAIVFKDGKLGIDLLPQYGMALWELEPLSADVLACGQLRANPPSPLPSFASLALERKDGKVIGFWLSTERELDSRFDRIG